MDDTPRMGTNNADVVQERRRRLQAWIDQKFSGSRPDFLSFTKINSGELSGLLRTKSFGEKRAKEIERAANMPSGYLATPFAPSQSVSPDPDTLAAAIKIGYPIFVIDLTSQTVDVIQSTIRVL